MTSSFTETVFTINAEAAQAIIEAARKKAAELGKAMTIAVVDRGGELKGFLRMDGAPLLSVELSQNKAYTAASFGLSTAGWYEFIKDDPPLLHGIVHTPRLTVYGGGLPVMADGQLVGGVGVSGGHYSDDELVAQAGVDALAE